MSSELTELRSAGACVRVLCRHKAPAERFWLKAQLARFASPFCVMSNEQHELGSSYAFNIATVRLPIQPAGRFGFSLMKRPSITTVNPAR